MKEKITLIIILTSVVALLFHHQSQDNSTQLTSVHEDVSTPPEIPLTSLELVENGLGFHMKESVAIDECEMDPTTTDNLAFKDAFTHFRKCLGSNQAFSWKDKSYLTLLAEEVENVVVQVADSTTVEKVNNSDSEVVIR
jgi:hypothetical protein